MPMAVNGITIQVEWICRKQSTAKPTNLKTFNGINIYKLNVYAEHIQRHKHLS
jgi:hypothetical protein